jgi:2,3-bisphosphoglycerate-independent phosphoglycerate mutase
MSEQKNKVILVIMDGWGHSTNLVGNAIAAAKTPNFDAYWNEYPHALLEASGESVGLPEGQMGTSEVNHMTIGAGRVIFQDLVKINKAIENDELAQNHAIMQTLEHVKAHNSTLHLKGLVSPNGVHSHQNHFYGLLSLAKRVGVQKVLVHVFTDGRDTLPKSAKTYIKELEDFMEKLGLGRIASISGRYYAMDRDNNWDRIDLAYDAMTKGSGARFTSALDAIEEAYNRDETDEFIQPAIIEKEAGEWGAVSTNDAIIFVNYRSDRAVQLTKKFLQSDIENLRYTTMTQYHEEFQCEIAFPPEKVENTLGEVISAAGLKQLRITETEKFNHVTYFFNSKKSEALEGEDRIMLDTHSDIKTHDMKPEMRAYDITQQIVMDMEADMHDVIISNLCNPDMVGHTANMPAVITAVETVDNCIKQIVDMGLKKGFTVILTADHGNAEELIDEASGGPKTSHTLNPVPCIVISKEKVALSKETGVLSDIAPTILDILNLPKPQEMTGTTLLTS